MTAQISAYGLLVADPQTRTTNSGTSMTIGRLAVALPCHAAEGGEVTPEQQQAATVLVEKSRERGNAHDKGQ